MPPIRLFIIFGCVILNPPLLLIPGTSSAIPSMPMRRSTGSTATRMRICGLIEGMHPPHACKKASLIHCQSKQVPSTTRTRMKVPFSFSISTRQPDEGWPPIGFSRPKSMNPLPRVGTLASASAFRFETRFFNRVKSKPSSRETVLTPSVPVALVARSHSRSGIRPLPPRCLRH